MRFSTYKSTDSKNTEVSIALCFLSVLSVFSLYFLSLWTPTPKSRKKEAKSQDCTFVQPWLQQCTEPQLDEQRSGALLHPFLAALAAVHCGQSGGPSLSNALSIWCSAEPTNKPITVANQTRHRNGDHHWCRGVTNVSWPTATYVCRKCPST